MAHVGDPLKSLPIYMMIGIVVVIGVSQVHRLVGSILGVIFWTAVAVLGTSAYEQGGAIGFPGMPLSQGAFYALCAAFVLIHLFAAYTTVRAKKRAAERRMVDDG